MAGYTRGAGSVDEDCLHSCLPGPVDTYSRMVLESFIARRAELDSAAAAVAAAAQAADFGSFDSSKA